MKSISIAMSAEARSMPAGNDFAMLDLDKAGSISATALARHKMK